MRYIFRPEHRIVSYIIYTIFQFRLYNRSTTPKYKYQLLLTGLCNSPDIVQEQMLTRIKDLEFCRAHMNDLVI
jgi:hypothetical protein